MNLDISLTGYVVMGLFILLILAINLSLFTAIKKSDKPRQVTTYKSIIDKARSPWQDEDDALTKLHQLVNSSSNHEEHNQEE